jgi:hypothetical protein
LKRALEDSVADPERLHQRLFFALCRDLTNLAALENSVEATTILDLVSAYATGEWEARKPDLEVAADSGRGHNPLDGRRADS